MKIKNAIINGTYYQEPPTTFRKVMESLPASEVEYIRKFIRERQMAKDLESKDWTDDWRDNKMTLEAY